MIRRSVGFAAATILALGVANAAKAQVGFRFWAGNVNEFWSVPGNWLPSQLPDDTDFIQIGNVSGTSGDTTVVDDDFVIGDLELYNDADVVVTTGSSLTVLNIESLDVESSFTLRDPGCTVFVNSGGQLIIAGDPLTLDDALVLQNGTRLELRGDSSSTEGGIAIASVPVRVHAGAAAGGHGEINITHPFAFLNNNGQLFVSSRPGPSGEALPGTLTITTVSGTAVGLDGGSGDGAVDVDDGSGVGSTSLTLNAESIAPFGGQMDIGNDDTVDIASPWEIIEKGALPAVLNFNDAGTHTLAGGSLTVSGSTSQVNLNGGTTVFENNLTVNDGTFTLGNNAIAQFGGTASFAGGARLITNGAGTHVLRGGALTVNGAGALVNLQGGVTIFDNALTFHDGDFMLGNNATAQFDGGASFADATDIGNGGNFTSFIVNSTVNIGDGAVTAGEDFNWDGDDAAVSGTAVNALGQLNINVENIDVDGTDTFNGVITMNSGDIDVQVADGGWVMDGLLNINTSPTNSAVLTGDAVQIGNNIGVLNADLNVSGTGIARITPAIAFESDADVNIAAGAILQTEGNVIFDSVTGTNNAEFTGSGTWRLAGTNTVADATTINMTGGTVDLDNSTIPTAAANDTFVNAPLTINAANLISYGTLKNIGGSLSSSDLIVDHFGAKTGTLTVNLDSPTGIWTVNNQGTLVLFNDNTEATLLAGDLLFIVGVLLVTGDVRTDARLHIEGTVSINTPGEPLRLSGGNLTDQPNTIVSGTIHGPGILGADTGTSLRGNGVINANIDFDGTAELRAHEGILTVNGTILDANIVGTLNSTGILNVTNPWNMTGTVGLVQLLGGELRGGTVTTAGFGIIGSGLVSAPVINNTAISANLGTLAVQTAANNNDWDGTTGTGQLNALTGNLEIRDNAQFLFTGTVNVGAGRTAFANGFELRFQPASTLNLTGGTYHATHETTFFGTVSVGAGTSTLENDDGYIFATSSNITLTGDLRLETGIRVQAGADFKGGGNLVNASLLDLPDGANFQVGIVNQSELYLDEVGIAQVDAIRFEQTAAGALFIDLAGTAVGNFDRLQLTNTAQLDGALSLSLTGGYVPALSQFMEIIIAGTGVSGTFESVNQPFGMPAGLMFAVVQSDPKRVGLKVIAAPQLPGDYNQNGTVDAADYVVWRKNLGSGTSLPNDDSPGVGPDDYTRWRARFGTTLGSGASAPGSAGGLISAVPEPAGMAMLATVLIFCIARGRVRTQATAGGQAERGGE